MVRRKLLLVLGSLVIMLFAAAIAVIVLLNGVLGDLDRVVVAAETPAAEVAAPAEGAPVTPDETIAAVAGKLRRTTFGLGLAFLVLINAAILVLLKAATMVLRPVETLVDASRRLAHEEFDVRIDIGQDDEFGELAHAFNNLASQLQENEQRKIETLHQVARTLSHELNNAISIIELQLELVSRAAGPDVAREHRLQEIHDTLGRMSGIVEALTRVRRIVLTDYIAGVKMLDLNQSVVNGEPEQAPVVGTPAESGSR